MRLACAIATAALWLSGCGGSAGSDTTAASSDDRSSAESVAGSASGARHLFVPDLAGAALVTGSTATPEAGSALPAATPGLPVSGNDVQLDAARDELYVIDGDAIAVYASAGTLVAGAAPVRRFALPSTLTTPRTLYLDTTHDILYVGGDLGQGGGEIVAYASAHAVRAARTPARTMLIEGGVSFFTIDVPRERLYVVNGTAGVHVYADAETADGELLPATTIPVLGTGLAVDSARDRLYVADPFAGLILVDQASAVAPVVTATVTIADAGFVDVDPVGDRAWVSAGADLYVIDNASELTPATTLPAAVVAAGAGVVLGTVAVR